MDIGKPLMPLQEPERKPAELPIRLPKRPAPAEEPIPVDWPVRKKQPQPAEAD